MLLATVPRGQLVRNPSALRKSPPAVAEGAGSGQPLGSAPREGRRALPHRPISLSSCHYRGWSTAGCHTQALLPQTQPGESLQTPPAAVRPTRSGVEQGHTRHRADPQQHPRVSPACPTSTHKTGGRSPAAHGQRGGKTEGGSSGNCFPRRRALIGFCFLLVGTLHGKNDANGV